jgi:hypothetical protein
VPYKARAFCTQQQRQQVAGRLFGLQLVLLLQELRVPPQQQEQVGTAAAAAAAVAVAVALRATTKQLALWQAAAT